MKTKLHIYCFLVAFSSALYGQTTIKLETFNGASPPTLPSLVTGTDDWQTTGGGLIPVCNTPSTSAGILLEAIAIGAPGTPEYVVFGPFDFTHYSSATLTWNGYRMTGAPTLTLSCSNVSPTTDYTTVTSFTDVPTNNAWHSLPLVSLPSNLDGSGSVYIKLSYDMTGATEDAKIGFDDWTLSGIQSPIFYWDGIGPLDNLSSWGLNIDGSGTNPLNFSTQFQTFAIVNGNSPTLTNNWAVSGSLAIVRVGNGTTWNPNFTIPSSYALSISGGAGLIVSNNATLTLQNTTVPTLGSGAMAAGSTVNYAQTSTLSIATNNVFHNLTISGGANKKANNLTVNGILNLNGADLISPTSTSQTLTLNGTITGSGAVQTSNNSRVIINGTGTFGSIAFSSTTPTISCGELIINRSSSGLITLNSDLKINTIFSLSNGKLDLNGKHLQLGSKITFPTTIGNGSIKGSTTSTLSILTSTETITNNLLMDQTNSASRSLYNFTMNRSSATVIVGNPLDIRNSIFPTLGTINSNGNITLKANVSRSAMIDSVGGAVNGTIKTETYIGASGITGWTNLGSSGTYGLTLSNWDGQFPMTCNGCITGTNTVINGFASMQTGYEPGAGGTEYATMSSNTAIEPGVGIWAYIGTGSSITSAITVTAAGLAVQGDFTVSLTKTPLGQDGYNLIANPYPAPISWTAAVATNTIIDGTAYLYSPVAGVVTISGAGVSAPGGYITNGVIPRGEGFYVNATTAGTFSFTESMKSTANSGANPLLKTSTSTFNDFRLRINGPSSELDEAVFIFDNATTKGFDRLYDAYKRFGTPKNPYTATNISTEYTTINSITDNKEYAINALPLDVSQKMIIPIRTNVMTDGAYSISPIDIQNVPTNNCVMLNDKLLNVSHDLRNGAYNCTLKKTDNGNDPRFELLICANSGPLATSMASYSSNNYVAIGQDEANGVSIKIVNEAYTKTTISAYNVMGQKIMADKEVEGTDTLVNLEFNDLHNQIIIIKASNEKSQFTKKVFLN